MQKICKIHGLTEHNKSERRKKCMVDAVKKRRAKVKQISLLYKGGKCENCGYSKCPDVLEFHHINPEEKEFGIGSKGYTRSWKKIKEELDKCVLLCANCHRELHYKQADYIFTKEELQKELDNK